MYQILPIHLSNDRQQIPRVELPVRLDLTMKTGFGPILEAVQEAEKNDRWHRSRRQKAQAIRRRRLKLLRERSNAIRAALKGYSRLDRGQQPTIRLRTDFIWLDTPRAPRTAGSLLATRQGDVDTRPPNTKLIHRPGNAQQVYLGAIYAAHLEFAPGARVDNRHHNVFDRPSADSWATLNALGGSGVDTRELNLRMVRALRALHAHRLVGVGHAGAAGRYDAFTLLDEGASGKRYRVPGEGAADVIGIPAGFFRAGWHLVLTAEELATLLIIIDATQRFGDIPRPPDDGIGIGIADKTKWGHYGIRPEAYTSLHELKEFGLIDVHDLNGRVGGMIPGDDQASTSDRRTLRLIYPLKEETDYDDSAFDVVTTCLADSPLPPRMND
ncbi:hypothetical protein MycrhDRAFT_7009 [Mycolicibacterium rhodesiae JS60]|nr:hypothetical protein MycrhDRAFT_7009 [Mycolicibacterium rhodesiae JS60]